MSCEVVKYWGQVNSEWVYSIRNTQPCYGSERLNVKRGIDDDLILFNTEQSFDLFCNTWDIDPEGWFDGGKVVLMLDDLIQATRQPLKVIG